MPHGYECDRCGTFVEQGKLGSEVHPAVDGPVELVHIANPNTDGDGGPSAEEYTLCDDCRDSIITMVEAE